MGTFVTQHMDTFTTSVFNQYSFFAESRLYDTWSGYIWLRKCTACCFLRSAVCLTALCEHDRPELTLNYMTNSGVFDCYVLWSWVKLTLTAIQLKDYLTTSVGSYVYIYTVQSKPCRLTFDPLKVMRLVNAEQLIWFELSPRVQCGNRAAPRQPQLLRWAGCSPMTQPKCWVMTEKKQLRPEYRGNAMKMTHRNMRWIIFKRRNLSLRNQLGDSTLRCYKKLKTLPLKL